jgi:glycosyltransferase involved in cell wall biosynthesis
MSNKIVSLIIPVYNEEEVIVDMLNAVKNALKDIKEDIEIVCVNDGSKDNTCEILRNEAMVDERIKVIDLSRNFGHQIAVTAGVDHCKGDCAIIIDADLQDPPSLIPEMIAKWKENYHVVYAKRKKRKGEAWFKLWTARLFYRLLKRITRFEIPIDTGDFRLIDRKVIEALKDMPESSRYIRGMVAWVGFNQIGIEYERQERFAGESKYPFKKSLALALDGIIGFSFFPLRIATWFGFIISGIAFLYAIFILYKGIFTDEIVAGWPSMMVVMLFIGGIILMMLGIIGEYLGRTSMEVKKRPPYFIKETIQKESRDKNE